MKKLRVTVNGVTYDVEVEVLEDDDDMAHSGPSFPPSAPHPSPLVSPTPAVSPRQSSRKSSGSEGNELTSPIAGVIEAVNVSVGSVVKENDPLIVIEAMKMHTNISSPVSGKVKEILVKPGDAVLQGQVLLTFEKE